MGYSYKVTVDEFHIFTSLDVIRIYLIIQKVWFVFSGNLRTSTIFAMQIVHNGQLWSPYSSQY